MSIETQDDLQGLRTIGRIVAEALADMQQAVTPGMTTAALDQIAAAHLSRHGARSAPQVTYDFPGASCISINDEAAHGIPGQRVIQPGDLVKIDLSAEKDGYFADACITVGVPPLTSLKKRLLRATQVALQQAMKVARTGQPVNAIGRIVEDEIKRSGFSVVRELPGHGVGRGLHEEPSVPNFYIRRMRDVLTEGMVITIEPHISARPTVIYEEADGWTLKTLNQSIVAAFEHTVVITKHGAEPVTVA